MHLGSSGNALTGPGSIIIWPPASVQSPRATSCRANPFGAPDEQDAIQQRHRCPIALSVLVGGERPPYTNTCPTTNSYKFTGKERDTESGLDNFAARFDSSSVGRFLSPDPLGGHTEDPQTFNRYTYVRNNPLNLTDPTGLDFYLECEGGGYNQEKTGTCRTVTLNGTQGHENEFFHAGQSRWAITQENLSRAFSLGRGCLRLNTVSCCRRARFSSRRPRREQNRRAIVPTQSRIVANINQI
jgi:RHS repeat-associated protein